MAWTTGENTLSPQTGRLCADISLLLRHPVGRRIALELIEDVDPLALNALAVLAKRPEFLSCGERFNPLRLLPVALPYIPKVLHSLFWGNSENVTEKALALIAVHLATVKARLDAARDVRERLDTALSEVCRALPLALTWA